ncbi:CopG family transcriptional regulator, nickel-responsive regulator [Cohaesibacter marisflavi]|uniref:CopG family transcriptional regulator, nickel-responsive regulator n=1 Tax=Cohaesibacter marisflavi TaxID=655353 RepID=A0A1I5KKW5_9HYPH|nr:nickel-responsive transcriptional regulator NikR [Cohaesibacter marisflavi]SFO85527.1 CopG family transcriptional regulator, nickel-responsive regulator [Cohaesibacter marisflavi]
MNSMTRTTITLDAELTEVLDRFIARSGASNRSEAIRDLIRRGLAAMPAEEQTANCIAVVSCTVDHSVVGLEKKLQRGRHDRHGQILYSTSLPIDHDHAFDVTVLRGSVEQVNDYAQALFLERGIKHGAASLTPVDEDVQQHSHAESDPKEHVHLKVRESF